MTSQFQRSKTAAGQANQENRVPNALIPQIKSNREGSHPAQKEEAGRTFGKELGNALSQQSVDASKASEPSKLSAKPLDLTRKVAL